MKKPNLKNARVAYLYADSHMVVCYEKNHRQAGKIEWVEIFENPGVIAEFKTGRVVIHDVETVAMVLNSKRLDYKEPSIENGSINSKKLRLPVGHIRMDFGMGYTYLQTFDGIISSGFSCQPEGYNTTWEEETKQYHWGDKHIRKFHPAKSKTTV